MRVERTEWLDWLVDGEESAVFVDGTVSVLSALATAIVERAADGATIEELVEVLVERFGAPDSGDAEILVREAVESLTAGGVLRPAEA